MSQVLRKLFLGNRGLSGWRGAPPPTWPYPQDSVLELAQQWGDWVPFQPASPSPMTPAASLPLAVPQDHLRKLDFPLSELL